MAPASPTVQNHFKKGQFLDYESHLSYVRSTNSVSLRFLQLVFHNFVLIVLKVAKSRLQVNAMLLSPAEAGIDGAGRTPLYSPAPC